MTAPSLPAIVREYYDRVLSDILAFRDREERRVQVYREMAEYLTRRPKQKSGPRKEGAEADERYLAAALRSACERIAGAAAGEQERTLNAESYGIGTLLGADERAEDALVAAGMAMRAYGKPWRERAVRAKVRRALRDGARRRR